MSNSPRIQEDYEAIEAAVMESPRGRWFLSEYLHRNQARETRKLLASMRKLERVLARQAPSPGDSGLTDIFSEAARELSALTGADAAPPLSEAVLGMAAEAAEIAAQLEEAGEWGASAAAQAAILASRQHNLARRLEVLAKALEHADAASGQPRAATEPELTDDNLGWFEPEDEELFEGEPIVEEKAPKAEILPPEEDTPSAERDEGEQAGGHMSIIITPEPPAPAPERPKASRPRITITRKPSSEEVDIPRYEKDPETAA